MKLSNLEITSEVRLTQPASGDEYNQTTDIRFGVDAGSTVSSQFYELLMYEMLNGVVNGEDDVVTTGIKTVYYDATDAIIAESNVVPLDKIMTEMGTELVAMNTATKLDSSVTEYLSKVDLIYVANDSGVADEKLIFTSIQPQKTSFAESTGVGTAKGVAIPANGGDATLKATFKLFWK